MKEIVKLAKIQALLSEIDKPHNIIHGMITDYMPNGATSLRITYRDDDYEKYYTYEYQSINDLQKAILINYSKKLAKVYIPKEYQSNDEESFDE